MSEIVFDTFNPDLSCDTAPPTNPQQQDPCTVDVSFHLRDEKTPEDPHIVFRRSQDHFVLETHMKELETGLLKSAGFKEDSPLLQSSLFYSIAFNRWMRDNYPVFVQNYKYKGSDLLPLGKKLINFLIAGSIEKPDPDQIAQGSKLLKEILQLSQDGRDFFTRVIEILKKDKTGVIRKEVEPRTTWLLDLLTDYEKIQTGLTDLKSADPAKAPLEKATLSFLAYVGIGDGKMENVISEIDAWVGPVQSRQDFPERAKDYYQFLLWNLTELKKSNYFKNDAGGKERVKNAEEALKKAIDEHRAELFSLSDEKALNRSLELKLIDAAFADDLTLLVRDELKSANLSASWLRRQSNIEDVAEAILPTLKWTPEAKGAGLLKLDVQALAIRLNKLIDSHSIQEREFMIGSLAALRFYFGKTLAAVEMKAWVRKGYVQVPLQISEADRAELLKIGTRLEKKIASSLRKTSIFLPLGEAGSCVGGLAIGIGGAARDDRLMTVGGSSFGGLGCGALLTHYLYPTRNQYISDTVGGVIAGLATFALSYWLTGRNGDSGDPGRNPVNGYGP